jgi:CheY-like chemotaxis protein
MAGQRVLLFHLPQELLGVRMGILSRPPWIVEAVTQAGELLHILETTSFRMVLLRLPADGLVLRDVLPAIRGVKMPCARCILMVLVPQAQLEEHRSFLGKGVSALLSDTISPAELEAEIARQTQVSPRVDARVMVRLKARVRDQQSSSLCQTDNVSLSGMFLNMSRKPPVGSMLAFELMIPGSRAPVCGEGRVVRHASGGREKHEGIGVAFCGLQNNGRQVLTEFLNRARPAGTP